MKIEQVMSRDVKTCRANDSLKRPAQLMWQHDIGSVPVVDDSGAVIGMITDRDITMAALSQGRRLDDMLVSSAMSRDIKTVDAGDRLEAAAAAMKQHQVRRLPVLKNRQLAGVVSLNDLSRVPERETDQRTRERLMQEVETTLAVVGRPRFFDGPMTPAP